ncbi:MAG TPA: tail fiber domain-containing protein, partial [Vicinamibacteria bacterium]|nr:tail fiber domain-containing protein [Vicinamibacteria bacterium]
AYNTAGGYSALAGNTTGAFNTAIGVGADVTSGGLNNATAIGYGAKATASDMVRIGNGAVTVIQGQVAFTASSDRNKKENLRDVNAQEILAKLRGMSVTSWNYIGHDPKEFRHYGPMAQDFFAAFGRDEVGAIGTETTINSGDIAGILMIGLKGLDAQVQKGLRTIDAQAAEIAALKQQTARIADLEVSRQALTAELASLKAQVGRIVELEAQTARVVAVLQGLAVQSASSVSAPAAKGAEEPRK